MKRDVLLMGALIALSVVLQAVTWPAQAGDADVRRSSGCSARSEWKLKLSPEDGGVEVEYEVDQNVNGETWRVVLKHDGNRVFKGRRTTQGPSGSFEVRKVVNDSRGTDLITARAGNLSSDEVCRGSASI